MTRRAVVTGASSGIGEAVARTLRGSGWEVVGVARRADRLEKLAAETGAEAFAADLTRQADIDALAEFTAQRPLHALVHVAGGALGTDRVEDGDSDGWLRMYEMNTLSAQRLVKALLPQLRSTAAAGSTHADALFVTSTAAQVAYPGGGGYNAAKAGEAMLVAALRQELLGEPIRVVEIAPGMVRTEEFALTRLGGDKSAADAVYAGVESPLTADDVADVIAYSLNAPGHVNLDLVTLRPVAQAAQHLVHRGPLAVHGTD
ncbi:SDR family oxidoreductase [Microbacterium amylolyticum]|uniref:NADP-dependent 3-hydroxy acid dehydrogenase YdfG n=1 Tax=Microbacterium amylolyticum TaxID=936337 RepID=A0ABS4ZH26_9MICO|nr:SDR family oxidoreductase [Microbacterium amylolyticum]MBP2436290.1 NADP-dependent 3-hydroxy acid dehydrogenase YdfG [Microbacterium amylolyticum]